MDFLLFTLSVTYHGSTTQTLFRQIPKFSLFFEQGCNYSYSIHIQDSL